MGFSISTMCGSTLIPQHFHDPPKQACTHQQSLVFPLCPQALAMANLFFISTDLPVLDISHKNYSIRSSVTGFFGSAQCVKSSSMLLHVSLLCSFFTVK